MQISVSEFLKSAGNLRKRERRVEALKANDSYVLRTTLQGFFDPRINWLIPPGTPPYKPNELVDQEGVYINEVRRLIYFVDGPQSSLPQIKREAMFIELLERVAPGDAEMLIAMKDQDISYLKGIDTGIINEAFPGLLPNEQEP